MARKQAPRPPQTDNPIDVPDPLSDSPRYELLAELLSAEEAGDIDLAAKYAATALTRQNMPRELVDAMVGRVHNLAVTEDHFSPAVKSLLCKAADKGFCVYAYAAANIVRDGAKSVRAYRQAERYYKLAMSCTEEPARQAAAHVNYGRMVREGLISGAPDLPAAIEIFEAAARMGLVKGMFHAGETSSTLAQEGDRAYGARAIYWFQKAMETRACNAPTLDYESKVELERQVYENCMFELSALNIDLMYDGADVGEGIRWGRELAERGSARARRNLQIAYMRRLTDMTAMPAKSPGGNWKAVLSQMDWQFKGKLRTITFPVVCGPTDEEESMKVDVLTVSLRKDKRIHLFVVHDACLPAQDGFELLSAVARVLHQRHPEGFLLVSRKALFIEQDGMSYTPIYVMLEGRIRPQALWLGCLPDDVLQRANEGVEFLDQRFGNDNCILPIAVNTLDEGYVVATDAALDLPWVGVGEPWCMPFINSHRLPELGIIFEGGRVLMLSRDAWQPKVG
jgi:TPR repeat protein